MGIFNGALTLSSFVKLLLILIHQIFIENGHVTIIMPGEWKAKAIKIWQANGDLILQWRRLIIKPLIIEQHSWNS